MSESHPPDAGDWRDVTQAEAGALPEEGTDPGLAHPGDKVVLVALDFSTPARRALHWALEHVAASGGVLHVVHVIDRRFRPSDLSADVAALTRELADVERAAAAELRAVGDEARARIGAVHEHIAIGRPGDEIVRVARELGAHTIVVGSHGHDAISHALLGSVAERVVRTATCTVVVVKT